MSKTVALLSSLGMLVAFGLPVGLIVGARELCPGAEVPYEPDLGLAEEEMPQRAPAEWHYRSRHETDGVFRCNWPAATDQIYGAAEGDEIAETEPPEPQVYYHGDELRFRCDEWTDLVWVDDGWFRTERPIFWDPDRSGYYRHGRLSPEPVRATAREIKALYNHYWASINYNNWGDQTSSW